MNTLSILSPSNCILGQVFGNYWYGCAYFLRSLIDPINYLQGFTVAPMEDTSDWDDNKTIWQDRDLVDAWTLEVNKRRLAPTHPA